MMESKEELSLLQKNELLAEFLEFQKFFGDGYGLSYDYKFLDPRAHYDGSRCMLKFHSSWEWLMCVVEKIETMCYMHTKQGASDLSVGIHNTMCWVEYNGYYSGTLAERTEEDKKKSVFETVVLFVQKFNENPDRYLRH